MYEAARHLVLLIIPASHTSGPALLICLTLRGLRKVRDPTAAKYYEPPTAESTRLIVHHSRLTQQSEGSYSRTVLPQPAALRSPADTPKAETRRSDGVTPLLSLDHGFQ